MSIRGSQPRRCLARIQFDMLAPIEAGGLERALDKILDAVRVAARDHEILGLVFLHH